MPEEIDLKTALAKLAAKESELKEVTRQLDASTDKILKLAIKIDDAASKEKTDVVNELHAKYPTLEKDALLTRDLAYLYDLKKDLGEAKEQAFLSLAREHEKDAAKKPQFTVGYFNPETKKWEGGV